MADRPSRFDVLLELKEPSQEESEYLFEKFLGRKLEENEVMLKDLSIAHIKEICLKHLCQKMSLQEAYDQAIVNRKKFKNSFVDKNSMGLGFGQD